MDTTIATLTAEIRAFRDARDWLQFHNPKELAVAIAAEAGELLQHFVWQSPEQSDRRVADRRDAIASEVADFPRSVILNQVENGIAVRMAVLDLLIGPDAAPQL